MITFNYLILTLS